MSSTTTAEDPSNPFYGASELLRLVFGDVLSTPDDMDATTSSTRSFTAGRVPLSRTLLRGTLVSKPVSSKSFCTTTSTVAKKRGITMRPYKDFLGVPEDSDPDVLLLWQMKGNRQLTDSGLSLTQVHGFKAPASEIRSISRNDGQHLSATNTPVSGWEPSEGEPLPLVNISFDPSVLGPAQPSNTVLTKELHSPNNKISSTQVPLAGDTGSSTTFNEETITTSTTESNVAHVAGAPKASKRPASSEDLVDTQGPTTIAPLPLTVRSWQPASRLLPSKVPAGDASAASMNNNVNFVRKFHSLVPPHLARSITKSTMKAREDESIRLRLQQDSARQPNNISSSGARTDLHVASIRDDSSPWHQTSDGSGMQHTQGYVNNRQPPFNNTPQVDSANTMQQQPNPDSVAISYQVAVPSPINNIEIVASNASLADHEPQSAGSRVSAENIMPDHAQSSQSIVPTGAFYDANLLDHPSGQPKLHPLSTSNIANLYTFQSSTTTQALQTLKRAWSDAEIGNNDSLSKKPRI